MDSDILTIPHKVESRNQLDRKHWAVKRECKKIWALFVRSQMRLKKIKESADEGFILTFNVVEETIDRTILKFIKNYRQ